MNAWAPIIFFDGEDEAALKASFVLLSAKHKGAFTPEQIAMHVFKDLPDPQMRALQAGVVWTRDLDVQEAIRQAILTGDESPTVDKAGIERRLLQVADDFRETAKDRIEALKTIALMNGHISKPIEFKNPFERTGNLPTITFVERSSDRPVESTVPTRYDG